MKLDKLLVLLKSPTLRQSTVVSGGNIVASVISAVTIMIISRYLGPSDFGIFSATFSLMLMTSKLSDFGINVALQRSIAKDKKNAHRKGVAIFYLKVFLAGFPLLLALFASSYIAASLLKTTNVFMVRLGFIFSAVAALFEFSVSFLNGLENFVDAVKTNMLQGYGGI